MLCTPWQLEQFAATTEPPSQARPVVAVHVGGDAIAWDAEFAGEADAFMTASTGIVRDVLICDGRIWIVVGLDGVDAVAVSTDGRNWLLPRAMACP